LQVHVDNTVIPKLVNTFFNLRQKNVLLICLTKTPCRKGCMQQTLHALFTSALDDSASLDLIQINMRKTINRVPQKLFYSM